MPYPHKFLKLTAEERKRISRELEALSRRNQFRKRKRLQAIWLSDTGRTFPEISARLDVTYQSVKMWISLYQKVGLDEYLARMKK